MRGSAKKARELRLINRSALALVVVGLVWQSAARWIPALLRDSRDLLAGAEFRASSSYSLFLAPDMFFHTGDELEPSITFDLRSAKSLSSLRVENSEWFEDRSTPLVAELSNDAVHFSAVARIDQPFRVWKPSFAAQSARYVRLKALKRTWLHLRRVQAFG